jgi:hypothetical protein
MGKAVQVNFMGEDVAGASILVLSAAALGSSGTVNFNFIPNTSHLYA